MGVVVHILDRRMTTIDVAGTRHEVGTLRHMSKITELDDRRVAELEQAAGSFSPPAAMVANPVDLPLALAAGTSVAAHLVIGWDEGRGSVTDLFWDYLPVLGYAVWDTGHAAFVLHELCNDALYPINRERAAELGLVLEDGILCRRGQPAITECRVVQLYSSEFAVADCVLEDGRHERFFIRVVGEVIPDPSWLVGRKPMDVQNYYPQTATG